ncbi:TLR adapter interacting with SLC15A4 on the lysosome [Hyperolius riggenbachi]|uniref:TLR adapter interacting with SLC15A4 on the lysosome n=1 Tax=Hyperolius riggenbachi TaxID=752182 RepID=UPI0035A27DC4
MLSEAYLSKIQYENCFSKCNKETQERKELAGVCTQNYVSAYETGSRRVFRKYGSVERKTTGLQEQNNPLSIPEKHMAPEEEQNPIYENVKSLPGSVSGNSQSNKDTYLVPSSCKNICRDYNDLHVAGDQVMAINSAMTEYPSNNSLDFCEGPFLQSSQILSAMDSLCAGSNALPQKHPKPDSSCWKVGSFKEKSIMNVEQPQSNSVLNDYLERKVIELYKQYMMDISCTTSPARIVTSEHIMNNIQQISMQLSREQNMETNKAKDMVISYLLRLASEKQSNVISNVISTPELQISSNLS